MSVKPEALRLANDLEAFYRLTGEGGMDAQAADELLHQHAEIEALKAENERLLEALAWAYNLRHLRGHSDPVVIPERFAPFIEAALRREDKT